MSENLDIGQGFWVDPKKKLLKAHFLGKNGSEKDCFQLEADYSDILDCLNTYLLKWHYLKSKKPKKNDMI